MSGISSGVGLISGINTADLIDQLIAFERRPVLALQRRSGTIDIRRTALLSLSAQLLAIRNATTNFGKPSFFQQFGAFSSNDGVVTARATEDATPSTISLRVHSLVTSHALITRGFVDADTTPVGAGVITIESAQGRVDRTTELGTLNGGTGVRRGTITITDRDGHSADIDLRAAVTVDDILEAINANTDINVRARVTSVAHVDTDGRRHEGDRIVIEDLTDGSGTLAITDANGGFTAADLGIAERSTTGRIDGNDVMRLGLDTPLALLNDGNGVGHLAVGGDLTFRTSFGSFDVRLNDILDPNTDLRQLNNGRGVRLGTIRITDRAGKSVDIDLSALSAQGRVTVGDVRQKIVQEAEAAGVSVSVTMVNSSFLLTDTSTPKDEDAKFVVEDVSGSAAADLGILAEDADGGFVGRAVFRVNTIGDVIRAINFAEGNDAQVKASVSADGNGLSISAFGLGNAVTVSAGSSSDGVESSAARDLGLDSATFTTDTGFSTRRLVAGLDTVLLHTLRGGSGVDAGTVSLTDAAGRSVDVDFSGAETLQDVVDLINAQSDIGIRARINGAGNGLELFDESDGAGSIEIRDVDGSLAQDLGLAGTFQIASNASIDGGNLQLGYITRNTLLSTLNAGSGVSLGSIRITDSSENVYVVELASNLKTMGQVVDAITRATPDTIEARINDNGDGIIVTDTSDGAARLRIADDGGRTASDLRLVGTAGSDQDFIDGSFETRIEIHASDTLTDIARKINQSGASASATVLNSGAGFNPFSLTITSEVTGRRGEIIFDAGDLNFGVQTLTRARDAVVTVGEASGAGSIVITSSTNQLTDVVEGVTFDLLGISDEETTITVDRDQDSVVSSVQSFVDSYNAAIDSIDQSTSFDSETFERGALFGDSTVNIVESRLRNVLLRSFSTGDPTITRLSSVGLRLGAGGKLEFNEERFREALEKSPKAVEALFTTDETGFGAAIQDTLEGLTNNFDGLLSRQNQLLIDQQDLLSDRAERLDILLAAKRARLERQFAGLESALAGLQGQQNALASLFQLATG